MEPAPEPSYPLAPELPLPHDEFYSVEYPGYVQPSSIPLAIDSLGGLKSLDLAFRKAKSKSDSRVECHLRPGNPFSHPISGETVSTNKILLKVVKKKRKDCEMDGYVGEFTTEAIGTIPKTARFRSMLDFQYQPDPEDPVTKLRSAMDNLDASAIYNYSVPKETSEYLIPSSSQASSSRTQLDTNVEPALQQITEDHPGEEDMVSNLRMFPPPLFSRTAVFQHYNFRSNPASVVQTIVDEQTGEEKKRLINKMRFKGYHPVAIHFSEPNIPTSPLPQVEEMRAKVDQRLLTELQQHFQDRPIWTRPAIFSKFSAEDTREVFNSKVLLPLVAYVFHDGPWRDTFVRFGYDPRKTQEARIYQRIYFRNVNNVLVKPSVGTRRQERGVSKGRPRLWDTDPERDADRRKIHIFDGKTVYKDNTAAFQLCDVTDPFIAELISQPNLRSICDERDGWYAEELYDHIRGVLRLKYFGLLEGRVVTDEECRELMLTSSDSKRSMAIMARQNAKPTKRKRPQAKGAVQPEDAAAMRLRAAMNSGMDVDE